MTSSPRTLILSRDDVAALATPRDYHAALDRAFRALAAGEWHAASVGHVPGVGGAFHIKSAATGGDTPVVAIKINGNFPGNGAAHGLPTIQGCLMLADARDGRVLALMDSTEITARRTAAASALAASRLARRGATTLALVGCGVQAECHLDALRDLDGLAVTRLRVHDVRPERARRLAELGEKAGWQVSISPSVADAVRDAELVVTTTTATEPLLFPEHIAPGTFIAAVGADNPGKCEIAPALLARARVVPDALAQAVEIGDLRRAIADGAMTAADVHAELAPIVAGIVRGREDDDQVFVFDSTGTAIEDVAAAAMLHALATARGAGRSIDLNGLGTISRR